MILTWILAATDRGKTRFAICNISAMSKVALRVKLDPMVTSSSMAVSAYWNEESTRVEIIVWEDLHPEAPHYWTQGSGEQYIGQLVSGPHEVARSAVFLASFQELASVDTLHKSVRSSYPRWLIGSRTSQSAPCDKCQKPLWSLDIQQIEKHVQNNFLH